MKSILKKGYSLGLLLLGMFFVIGFISIANGSITIIKTAPDDSEHKVVLHSLYLSGDSEEILLGATTGLESLRVFNGLIVSSGNHVEGGGILSSVGGGMDNKVKIGALGGGIGGGLNNSICSFYTVIGGGSSNSTTGYNSVVVGGDTNRAYSGGVVLGGFWNNAYSGGVVLGGLNNKANGENSLVLGHNASGDVNSFAWNGVAQPNTARINANSGVLIGTVSPVDGVSLVVNGSIKLSKGSDITGAITMNDSGCITVYDGKSAHTLGSSESVCGVASGCQFGSTLLQNGDVVTGYVRPYDHDCNDSEAIVTCEDGNFNLSNGEVIDVYPYCYEVSSDFAG